MKVKPVAEVIEFLRPVAEETGVELVDAQWDMRTKSLTLYIDAESGVDLNLCEKFHRAADEPLDRLDPTFGEGYTLNCSSLGLDRPFKTARDFERNLGEKIEVHCYAPYKGEKHFEGVLKSFDEENVTVQTERGEQTIPRNKTSKICLYIEV